jgi:gas vesicle protein
MFVSPLTNSQEYGPLGLRGLVVGDVIGAETVVAAAPTVGEDVGDVIRSGGDTSLM